MRRLTVFSALMGVVLLTGCGGGGSGSSGTTSSSGSGRATVLLTDSFREDFGHVWATIYHVELVPQSGDPVVLYDNPSGVLIDLKTLRDSTGARYSFLNSTTIPAGTYTGIKVTIGSTMQLFRNGQAVGDPIPVSSTLPVDSSSHPIVSLTFKSPKTVTDSSVNNLIVDFDLAHFILKDSKILPVIQEGDGTGLDDPSRHDQGDYLGTVSNLSGTAPNLAFTLNRGNGMTITVVTTASTAVFGASSLANSSIVEVNGTIDPTTQNLVATQLEVRHVGDPSSESGEAHAPRVEGAASSLDATAGTFVVTLQCARGFVPSATTVNVVTSSTTTFRSDAGATLSPADFFAAVATTSNVEAEGTYDATSNTLTATAVKIDDHSKDGGWEHATHTFRDGHGDDWGNGIVPPSGSGHGD